MIRIFKLFIILQMFGCIFCFRNQFYTKEDILGKREEVRKIFQHAYDGYLNHASGYDELRPLTCDGINTWGSYSLTLIDALDTLAVMGNFTEFRRVVQYLTENSNFDSDINVSVFETNIRIVGGLLSAHLMSRRAGIQLEPGWPCNGPLLRMAEDVGRRLLPAFDTKTGMPYGTVNLRYGVPTGETPITCTAGVGTFLVEFGTLSRLTGDPIYEEVALNAVYSLWKYRSPIGLFGNHIDVQTGRWTAQDSGIGAGVDSYFEYLVKGAILLNRPDLLGMFHESRAAIDKYMRKEDWYVWVSMTKAQITLPVFQSLEAFWPGILTAIGDIEPAQKTFIKYHSVWKQYGFLPEFYNIPNLEATANRESYPLRPEIIESAMFLYRATKDQIYLEFGEDMLTSIQHSARTECGYATIRNVRTHERENRMESFFLAETTKYLYLLFDPDNFIHNDGTEGILFETPNGHCILEAGNYIFNTEAHPIDPSALHCCHEIASNDIFSDFNIDDYKGEALDMESRKHIIQERDSIDKKFECPEIVPRNANITLDIVLGNDFEGNFSEIEKLLSQLMKDQNKKQLNNIKLSENQINEFDKIIWQQLEISINVTENNNSGIGILDFAEIIKNEMKKLIFKKEYFNSDMFSNLTLFHSDKNSNVTLYDIFITIEKNKVTEAVLDDLHYYSKNLTQNENINLKDLIAIVYEILASVKNNLTNFNFEEKVHHLNLLNILKKAQHKYENTLQNTTELYDFVLKFQIEIGTTETQKLISTEILKLLDYIEKIFTNNNNTNIQNYDNIKLNYEIFENFVKYIEIKKDVYLELKEMKNLIKDLKTLIESDNKKDTRPIKESSKDLLSKNKENLELKQNDEKLGNNDDLIVIEKNKIKYDAKDVGIGSVERVTIGENFNNLENSNDDLIKKETIAKITSIDAETNKKINEEIKKKIDDSDLRLQSPVLKSYGTDTTGEIPATLTELFQSILLSSIPSKPKFDPQILLEKIRSNGTYMNFTPKWELFYCKASNFLQKYYVQGLF